MKFNLPRVTWVGNFANGKSVLGRRRDGCVAAFQPVTVLLEIAIDRVFIGSCTNGRVKLRAAAKIAAGHKVSTHVSAMVVPGSQLVKAQAGEEGLDRIFREAGFEIGASRAARCAWA